MALGLEGMNIITIIQSILLIVSALIIIIAAIGILRMDNDMPNVVYARIHILGMIDVAGILAFLGLGQPLFALIYLFLAPLLAHALANAFFHGEDDFNNPVLNPNLLNEESCPESEDSDVSKDLEESSIDLAVSGDQDSDSEGDQVSGDQDSDGEGDQVSGDLDSDSEGNQDSDVEDVDNETTEEKDEENLNNSEGDDND